MFNIDESAKLDKIYDRYYSNDWDEVVLFISENKDFLDLLIEFGELFPRNSEASTRLTLVYDECFNRILIFHNALFADLCLVFPKLLEFNVKHKKNINRYNYSYKPN